MRRRLTTLLVVVLAVLLVAAVVVVGMRWWRDRDRTDLQEATSYAPADAERLSWTDWAAVRDHVGSDVDSGSSGAEVRDFLDDAFDDDLTSVSALVQSAPVLQSHFGFSPANAEWELFSQSSQGAVVVVQLPSSDDVDAVADHLEDDGFTRPSEDDGVWTGGETLLPGIGTDLTPELQYVALDADDGLVLTSDQEPYLRQVMDDLGEGGLPDQVDDVVAASGEPLSAAIYTGDRACTALAMSQADADDQATADRLVEESGDVDPVRALAMSAQPDGDVRVVMAFANGDQARANARSRATLASGPAPGQGGDFSDRFSVDSATADGDLVTLDLAPHESAYVLSDLSSGPVLFATC